MNKTINWNELTPLCWNIATYEGVDVGVGADMVFHNIRKGMGVHNGSYDLPAPYVPDYKALHETLEGCAEEERQAVNTEFNAWIGRCREHYKALCELWMDEGKSLNLRCRMMVELVAKGEERADA